MRTQSRAKTSYQQRTRRISRWRSLKWNIRHFLKRSYYVTLVLVGLSVLGACWWWVYSGKLEIQLAHLRHSFFSGTQEAGLTLKNIYMDGRKNFKKEASEAHDKYLTQVVSVLGVKIGDPLMEIPLEAIQARIRKIAWIKDAVVERQLPDTLHIHILERQPFALWQHKGMLKLVDTDGVVLEAENALRPKYHSLLRVVEEDAPQHMMDLMEMLSAQRALFSRVVAAVWVGKRRWDIHFDNQMTVKLPEINPQKAWALFARMDQEQHILVRNVRAVDLRLEERTFIDMPVETTKSVSRANGGKKT